MPCVRLCVVAVCACDGREREGEQEERLRKRESRSNERGGARVFVLCVCLRCGGAFCRVTVRVYGCIDGCVGAACVCYGKWRGECEQERVLCVPGRGQEGEQFAVSVLCVCVRVQETAQAPRRVPVYACVGLRVRGWLGVLCTHMPEREKASISKSDVSLSLSLSLSCSLVSLFLSVCLSVSL